MKKQDKLSGASGGDAAGERALSREAAAALEGAAMTRVEEGRRRAERPGMNTDMSLCMSAWLRASHAFEKEKEEKREREKERGFSFSPHTDTHAQRSATCPGSPWSFFPPSRLVFHFAYL